MAVPSSIADLSTTAASNSPAGSESIGTSLDDYLRAIQAIIKQENSKGADTASASSVTIPVVGSYFVITGTTGITGFADSWTGRTVVLKFSDAVLLTNSAGLILPGGANITTAAGDVIAITNESTGVWRCVFFQPASGYQRLDATLTALAGALTAAGKIPYATALNTLGELDFKDEDDMASDSATAVPSQQSVKTYVTAAVAAVGGTVAQIKFASKTDTFSSESTSYVDITGLSVSLTPTNASNNVLVFAMVNVGGATANFVHLQAVRDSTALQVGAAAGSRTRASASFNPPGAGISLNGVIVGVDSPGDTSAHDYKIQGLTSAGTFYINRSSTDTDTAVFGRTSSLIVAIEYTP